MASITVANPPRIALIAPAIRPTIIDTSMPPRPGQCPPEVASAERVSVLLSWFRLAIPGMERFFDAPQSPGVIGAPAGTVTVGRPLRGHAAPMTAAAAGAAPPARRRAAAGAGCSHGPGIRR